MEKNEETRRGHETPSARKNTAPALNADKVTQGEVSVNGTQPPDLLAFAREAVRLGFSVLPTTNDGEKVPGRRSTPMSWKPYQGKRPTETELRRWFSPTQEGLGVVTGNISGSTDTDGTTALSVEALDCDNHITRALYYELLERVGLGAVLARIRAGYEDDTPNGGHILWYCKTNAGNTKLAMTYDRDDNGEVKLKANGKPYLKTLIETKGEGGFIVIPPSHGATHKSGKAYVQVSGGLATIATITPEEREALLELARSLNEVIEPAKDETRVQAKQKKQAGTRPGDLWSVQATWDDVLLPHGWTAIFERAGVTYWRRPGKDHGISATTGYAGTDYLYVFSTSTEFDSERGYGKFSAYTLLNHGGDFRKAADDLLRKGYFPRGEEPPFPEDGEPAPAEEAASAGTDGRPKIRITTHITPVVNEAEKAVLAMPNGPHVFQRLRQLCLVAHNAEPPQWIKMTRPVGAPSIAALLVEQLRERMSQSADWYKLDARAQQWKPALPPEWAVKTLHGRGQWGFPVLTDVISAPTVLLDGTVIETPGYDVHTGLFLDTQGVKFPPIPTEPTLDEAVRAVAALKVPYKEFPFAEKHGVDAAISSPVTIVARHAVTPGCTPLFGADANRAGTGKGLFVDVSCTIATGRPASRWAPTHDPEEDRKALLTIALEGDQCVHIDNVTEPLGSPALDSALTAGVIQGRLLGLNKSATAPISAVFFASGNNLSYRGDMARRVVPITLETLLENPQDRTDFVQPNLLKWVTQEWPKLMVAALTIVKAYIVAGCPTQGIPGYGSFQEWSDLIRSSLIWAGCNDPCEGRKNLEAEADPVYQNLAQLLLCWFACYGDKAVTLTSVIGDISQQAAEIIPNKWNELRDALAAFDPRFDGKRLDSKRIGYELRAIRKRTIKNQRLIQAGTYNGVAKWGIQKV